MANFFTRFLSRLSPINQVSQRRSLFTMTAGVVVNEDTAMKVSGFNRGVVYLSTQIAKLPWYVKDDKNKIIQRDRIYNLLNLSPNPEMNAFSFKVLLGQHAIIGGNGFAEIERDTIGRPVAIWPLDPRHVDLWRDPSGTLWYRIIGGSIVVPGEDAYIRPRDMFHIKNFHLTRDGLMGQGLAAYASEALGISLGADQMASGLFANAGIPSGVLSHPGTMSDEAYKKLKESWQSNQTGRKAASVAILEEGVKWEPLNMDPQVLQFLESRKFGVIEIARFLGLPPTKLFDTGATTYNNVENSNLEVATDTLDAWARNWEMECDVKLLSNGFGGRYSEMDLYAIFRGDMTTRANYFSKMMQSGAMTPNEIREREGQPGYPGGDRFYIAVNNFTPADRIDEVIDAQVQKGQTQPEERQVEEPPSESDEIETELSQAALEFLKRK